MFNGLFNVLLPYKYKKIKCEINKCENFDSEKRLAKKWLRKNYPKSCQIDAEYPCTQIKHIIECLSVCMYVLRPTKIGESYNKQLVNQKPGENIPIIRFFL